MSDAPSWHVYVVRCADGTFYTGITTDTDRRLREHNGESGTGRRGAAYTRARRPVRLMYREAASDRAGATRRERAIKRLDRNAKERLLRATGGSGSDADPGCKAVLEHPTSMP